MREQRFTEEDWRLFSGRINRWQEAYIVKLNQMYMDILNGEGTEQEKFWKLAKKVRQDSSCAGVQADMKRGDMLHNIVEMLHDGVISMDDLTGFSSTLLESIRFQYRIRMSDK